MESCEEGMVHNFKFMNAEIQDGEGKIVSYQQPVHMRVNYNL